MNHAHSTRTRPRAGQRGFSFIEILVVMGIISVLVSMVVVIIPTVHDTSNRVVSMHNVHSLVSLMISRDMARVDESWPAYNGKNFVLSVLANNQVDRRNRHNLEVFFSPGDALYGMDRVDLERFDEVTRKSLKSGTDYRELTSYAGRRAAEREYLITSSEAKMGTLVICDDDDGPLHHADGIVAGYSHGNVKFLEWADLDMPPPADPNDPAPFLGDDATVSELRKLSSR